MKIEQLLKKKRSNFVESISPDASLREFAQKLTALRIGALIVKGDGDALLGIVSERDLLGVVALGTEMDCTVADIMTQNVITCTPDNDVSDVLHLMNTNAIRHTPVVHEGKLVAMVSIRELTTAYDLLQIEANTDPLTQLPNRRAFLENLGNEAERLLRYGSTFSLAMIDIDHFKNVNDTYGHDAGDKVLQSLSKTMVKEFRKIDHIGRLGGEEFAVLFPESDLMRAKIACARLLKTVRKGTIFAGTDHLKITISIGLTVADQKTVDTKALMKKADALLYEAKNAGRNRLVVQPFTGPQLRVISNG